MNLQLTAFTCTLLALSTTLHAAPPRVSSAEGIGFLDSTGHRDYFSSLNNRGQLAGSSLVQGKIRWTSEGTTEANVVDFEEVRFGSRAGIWEADGTGLVSFNLPDGDRADSYGSISCINDPGAIAGGMAVYVANPVKKRDEAFRSALFYSEGAGSPLEEIPLPSDAFPSLQSFASVEALNNSGILVGHYQYIENSESRIRQFQFDTVNSTFKDLGPIIRAHFGDHPSSWLIDLNDSGQILGHAFLLNGRTCPFILGNNQITELDPGGANQLFARAINNNGTVTGEADGGYFVYDRNALTLFPFPEGANSIQPLDINIHGDIVGVCSFPESGARGFLIKDGEFHLLDTLVRTFLGPGAQPAIANARKINDNGLILADGLLAPLEEGFRGTPAIVIQLADAQKPVVHDVSRLGNPISHLPGVSVTAKVGGEGIDITHTDGAGRISFSPVGEFDPDTLNLDPDRLFDFELRLGDQVRLYRNVRARDVIDGTVRLALPVRLYQKLDEQLAKLEKTGLLVGKYNTGQARDLMTRWNSTALENLPEAPVTHEDRDIALARLLTATEALAGLYASAEPICLDTAKLITNTITSILAFQKAAATIQAESAAVLEQLGSAAGLQDFAINFAIKAVTTSLKIISANLQVAFVDALKTFAPAPVTTLVDSSLSITISTVLGGMARQGAWNAAGGVAGGRTALLDSLIKIAGEQVGGRIFATLYVASTQAHLDLATVRARNLQGEGPVSEAYRASQQVAIDASIEIQSALSASSLIADTTKKWGQVADASQLLGRIPAAQILTLISQVIRGLNIAVITGTTVNNLAEYTELREDDASLAPQLAFNPNIPIAAPLPDRSPAGEEAPEEISPLFPAYSSALADLGAAVTNADSAAIITAGSVLLDRDVELSSRITSATLCVQAIARSAAPREPALDSALLAMRGAATSLDLARSDLYLGLVGALIPGFTDPAPSTAALANLVTSTTDAITSFETAAAAASTVTSGHTSPPVLAVVSHGIATDTLDNRIPPGPFVLQAQIINAGGEPAENVRVSAAPGETVTPLPAWRATSPVTLSLGTLAAGESRTVSWDAIATDLSPDGRNSAAVYQLTLAADSVDDVSVSGGFEIATQNSSFADWAASINSIGVLNRFNDDPDEDGTGNGLERFLGLHPASPDSGNLQFTDELRLRHPRAASPGTDAAATYQWSLDLEQWHPSGAEFAGVSVLLEPAVVEGEGTGSKTIELTPSVVSGDPGSLFFRIDVALHPDTPPPPAPVTPLPPVITVQPLELALSRGNAAFFTVEVDSEEPILYQWLKEDVEIPGAIASHFTIGTTSTGDRGIYSVRITGPGGSVISDGVPLAISGGGGGG